MFLILIFEKSSISQNELLDIEFHLCRNKIKGNKKVIICGLCWLGDSTTIKKILLLTMLMMRGDKSHTVATALVTS